MTDVQPIPDGYRRVTPYLVVSGASDAIDFYAKVFGATERLRLPGPDGTVGHAEIEIGDSVVMLADEFPDMGASSPAKYGGTPVSLHVYVEDVDATVERAVSAGATLTRAGREPLLRRPVGPDPRSVRPRVEHRHARGRRPVGRDGATRRRGDVGRSLIGHRLSRTAWRRPRVRGFCQRSPGRLIRYAKAIPASGSAKPSDPPYP